MRPLAASLVLVLACSIVTAKGQAQAPAVATADALPDARAAAAALPALHSLIVSRRGELLLEYYAPNYSRTRLANIKSASKSIIAMLVGIAIDRKLIRSVDEPIAAYFPELKKDP